MKKEDFKKEIKNQKNIYIYIRRKTLNRKKEDGRWPPWEIWKMRFFHDLFSFFFFIFFIFMFGLFVVRLLATEVEIDDRIASHWNTASLRLTTTKYYNRIPTVTFQLSSVVRIFRIRRDASYLISYRWKSWKSTRETFMSNTWSLLFWSFFCFDWAL